MENPHPLQFLIEIAGAAALLIWAVRLVRTGVERGFAAPLRIWLRHSAKNRLLAATSGMGAAVFLQSSTAVAVLVSNFVAKGGQGRCRDGRWFGYLVGGRRRLSNCHAAFDGAPTNLDPAFAVNWCRYFHA